MNRIIGFGIIGTGTIARVHAKAVSEIEGAKLVACYDILPDRAASFADEFGIRSYSSLDDFLSDGELDIVTITTPSGAHLEPALAAIEKGKNVIIEKPMEVTTERIDLLIRKAEEKGVILSGVFQSRFHEAPLLVKKAVEEGRFGRISLIDAQIKWYRTQEYYDSVSWRGTWKLDGGGALMNQGIHAIDLLCWLGGDVKNVTSRTATLGHTNIEVEDTAGAVVEFRSGAIGIIEGTTCCYPGFLKRIEICGTDGSAVIEEESLKCWRFKNETEEDEKIREKFINFTSTGGGASDPKAIGWHGHRRVFENVVEALRNGTKPSITGEEARKSVALIEAVYRSARENRTIEL